MPSVPGIGSSSKTLKIDQYKSTYLANNYIHETQDVLWLLVSLRNFIRPKGVPPSKNMHSYLNTS